MMTAFWPVKGWEAFFQTMDEKELEQYLSDAVMGRPHGFSVGDRHYALYPATLGKMFLLQRQIESLGVNGEMLRKSVSVEALRLAREKRAECLSVISVHTCKTKDELFDGRLEERIEAFEKELSNEDVATLMIVILTSDKTNILTKHIGLDKEQERLNAIMRIKERNDKNSLMFGGRSVYGTLIDAACERYGWTKDYVVWEIDYTSLRLMLADKVNSVYCSDDEMQQIPAWAKTQDTEAIKATKENMEKIKNMDWR